MAEKIKNHITEGPIFKALFLYFLPIFFGSLVQQSYNFVDALIIGRYAGAEALAAIDATYSYVKLLINVFIALALGGTIIISQHYGANAKEKVSEVTHTLIAFGLLGGLIITVIGIHLTPTFSKIMNIPKDIFVSSVAYLRIYFLGTIFSFIYNIGGGILRAAGDTKKPFYYLMASSILNILLDYIFIAKFNMGVSGAALGTIISQLLSATLIVSALMKTEDSYKLNLRRLKLHGNTLKEIFKIGLPLGGQSALYSVANMYMQGGINSFGTVAIAGWAICGKMDFVIWLLVDALGIAVTTFVAQNFGAGKPVRMRWSLRYGFLFAFLTIGVMSGILYFLSSAIAACFTSDIAIINTSRSMMTLIAPFYVIYIVSELLSGAIKGQGETFKPMLLTLIGTCCVRIGWIILILPQKPTVMTAILGYPVSWFVNSLLFVIYYIVFSKKRLNEHYSISGKDILN